MEPDTLEFHQVDHQDAVAWITLDRPDAQHSLTTEMADELRSVTKWAGSTDDVRTIVLTGTDGMFCTGADLRGLAGDASDERRLWAIARRLHAGIYNLVRAPKPVITAVEGVAAGGGFGLALAGDIVYLAEDARFEFAYPRIGLSGDGGVSYLLPRLIGLRRARELVLRDDPIDAPTAVELGLATETIPNTELHEEVADEAERLATGPTVAYGRFKQLTWDGFGRTFDDQLRAEVEVLSRLTRTDDYATGYESFTGGSAPEFTGS